ncbi:hypothetical protein [Collinsella stercoris]|uniref:hypothetical protein n=1 Tax=Collinsella stercoris TaxID=147206 RepID=UPI003AF04385
MNGNTLNLIRASQVKHHRLKHGNDMHVKPDSGMHGKSGNDKHAEPDNDIYVEHCNDMHVKPDNDMYAEPDNDARTRFQGLHRPIKSDPSYTKNPARTCEPGFPSQKG